MASGDIVKFLGCPLFIFNHEVDGLQDRETVPLVRVSIASYKALLFLQDCLNALPEELVGK